MIGEWREAADWFVGPKEKRMAEVIIREAFQYDAEKDGIIFSPVEIAVLEVGDEGVPENPRIGVKLLRGSARINGYRGSIVHDLTSEDLQKLRQATQRAWKSTNPGERQLNTVELDKVINEQSLEMIERSLVAGRIS